MPMQWVEPEVFMIHGGVVVYHVYKNNKAEGSVREFHYALAAVDSDDVGDRVFDVRDLDEWIEAPEDQRGVAEVIRRAIDNGVFDGWGKDSARLWHTVPLRRELWDELKNLAPPELPVSRYMRRYQWMTLAHIALGKAQMIEEGWYGTEDPADDAKWAAELREIATAILTKFQPGDGQL